MNTAANSPSVSTLTSSSSSPPPPSPSSDSTVCHHPVPCHAGLLAASHIILPFPRHSQGDASEHATTSTTGAEASATPDLHALGELGRHAGGWPSAHVELRQLLSFPVLVLLVRDSVGRPVAGGVLVLLRRGYFLLNTVVVDQDFRNVGLGRFVTCSLVEEHGRLAKSNSNSDTNTNGGAVEDVSFSLIATPLGVPVYSRVGFRRSPNFTVHLFEWRSASSSTTAATVSASHSSAVDQHCDRTQRFEIPAYDGNDVEDAHSKLDCRIIHARELSKLRIAHDALTTNKALLHAALHYYNKVVNPPTGSTQSEAHVAALANHSREDTARVAVVTHRGEKAKVIGAAWFYTHAANTTQTTEAEVEVGGDNRKNEMVAFLGPVVGHSIDVARVAVAKLLDDLKEECLNQEGREKEVTVTMLALNRPGQQECEKMWSGLGFEHVVVSPYMTMKMSGREGQEKTMEEEIGCCDTERYFCIRGYM